MSLPKDPPNRYGCRISDRICVVHNLPPVGRYWCEKSIRNKRQPVADDVYTKKDIGAHRRVIAVKDGKVCYSTGTNTNHWCNLSTFMDWIASARLSYDGATDEEEGDRQ